jgi:Protein of unknown function (DUF2934)
MTIQQVIQERSYLIWEREGRPHGRNLEHWLKAEAELSAEREAEPKRASPKAPAKSGAKGTSLRKR